MSALRTKCDLAALARMSAFDVSIVLEPSMRWPGLGLIGIAAVWAFQRQAGNGAWIFLTNAIS